jgi:hypothetical protein
VYYYIVRVFINALPGNSYLNTVQHATIDEAVFSMYSAPSNGRNGVLCDQLPSYATVLKIEVCFLCGPCRGYITRLPTPSHVEAESNTSTVTLRVVRGDEKGSLKSETVKYGRESYGTRTRELLRWRGPTEIVNDRPVLSSERAPHVSKLATV